MDQGVKIPNPEGVEIGDEVELERIRGGRITLHSGTKIYGSSTLILDHATLGYEAPVTVDNCQIGPHVQLKGGFFKKAVFLKKAAASYGSHVRQGTILEEEASIAHTVGLKHTILFPFVTLGSLINFCDCLMTGGTSRRDHSEVGSSYIHFNFTPNQDKATPSLMGNVPQGVMLDQPPIFLGGQGGLVGPCRLAFGTVIAAGTIYRKDELRPKRMLFEGAVKGGNLPFLPGVYRGIKRIVLNNVLYIGNLIALNHWYRQVRAQFISEDFCEPLLNALLEKSTMGIHERIQRLEDFANRMFDSINLQKSRFNKDMSSPSMLQQTELYERIGDICSVLYSTADDPGNVEARDAFLDYLAAGIKAQGKDYIAVINNLDLNAKKEGTLWLQGIIDNISSAVLAIIPAFK
jgi:UDP-N-acetylglucosamine/UDP-N-acetylgalactosamine diphosphorylase